jgi:hypothetical protein
MVASTRAEWLRDTLTLVLHLQIICRLLVRIEKWEIPAGEEEELALISLSLHAVRTSL